MNPVNRLVKLYFATDRSQMQPDAADCNGWSDSNPAPEKPCLAGLTQMSKPDCNCIELLKELPDGSKVRLTPPPEHDCDYTWARSQLVPLAHGMAVHDCNGSRHKYMAHFTGHMERLVRLHGLLP